jgi:anti-sigma regulatory factor (Ser/Thr protein kinase)
MELRIKNKMEDMPAIVSMVEEFGVKHRISDRVINEINLALDEILSNIIFYGYPQGETGEIMVRLRYRAGEVTAEIHDDGVSFDPLQAAAPDLAATVKDRRVGGLGITFVRELMDEVAYSRVANENHLLLTKKMPI